jgi:tetratricopeptide (TPR) repeat protein
VSARLNPKSPVPPFWQQLDRFVRYPLQETGLAALAGLTVARLVMLLPWPLSPLLNLVVWAGLYAYAAEVLRRSANGELEPPEVSLHGESEGRAMVLLQVLFLLAALLVQYFLGPLAAAATAMLLAFALPGATMSLAMDGNLGHALNPATWLAIAGRIGASYLMMVLLMIGLGVAQAYSGAVISRLPWLLGVLATYAVITYCVLVAFHAMGYLIYQFHDELGHVVEAPVRRRTPSGDPDQQLIDEAEELIEAGDATSAEKLLAAEIARLGGTPASHALYRRLLKQRGDNAAADRHARDYLAALMAQGREKEALDLARDCLALDPAFTLAQPDFVRPLARRAAQLQQSQLALALLKDFPARHPRHPDLAANVLLTAGLLFDKLGQVEAARALLEAHRPVLEASASRPEFMALHARLAELSLH